MSRTSPTFSPEVSALFDSERAIPRISASERVRAVSRARAALVAGVIRPSLPHGRGPMHWRRWAAVAAAACMASIAMGAAAYEIRLHLISMSDHRAGSDRPLPTPADPGPLSEAAPESRPTSPATQAQKPSIEDLAAAEGNRTPSSSTNSGSVIPPETGRAELRLLQQIRAAVAREDFAGALPLIADHTRRFRASRLVEEREALRVKTLAGLGRTDESRRAATAFQGRFPHSVLLPWVAQMPASGR